MGVSRATIPVGSLPIISLPESYIYSNISDEDVEDQLSKIVEYAKTQHSVVQVTSRGPVKRSTHKRVNPYHFGIYSVTSLSEHFEVIDWITNYRKLMREHKEDPDNVGITVPDNQDTL